MTADEVKSLLVKAFIEQLKSRSVEAISVREVAAAAGVNHGLVHRYFGSKQGLIDAAVEQLSAEIHAGRPDRAAMSAATFSYLRAHPEVALVVARACLDGPKEILAKAAPPRARLEDIVEPIRAALERMNARAVDPYLMNAVASATLLGWFVFKPLLKKGFGLPHDADDQLMELLEKLDSFVDQRT